MLAFFARKEAALPFSVGIRLTMGVLVAGLCLPAAGLAVEMLNDPKGYNGIPWGSSLANAEDLKLVKTVDRLSEFKLKDGLPLLGDAKIESITFIAIDEQFARVTIKYKGTTAHQQILTHFQKTYGPLDRTPGSMMRGLNQQFDWRGEDTEVTVLYEAVRDRGVVFIESRVLGPKFNEGLSETAY